MNTSATGGYVAPLTASLDGDALDDVLQAAVAAITGIPGNLVRPRWEPVPPQQPLAGTDWAAIGVMNETPDANAWFGHDPTGDGTDKMQRHVDLDVLVSFYGPNARGNVSLLRDGLAIAQNREAVAQSGVSFVASGITRNVPELVGQQWLQRCDLALQFRRLIGRTYPIDTITQALNAITPG